jgi:hypothetical protein
MLPALREKPPITFVPRTKKADKEGTGVDKAEYIKFEFFIDPKNSASRYSKELIFFKNCDPEE